MQCFVLYTHNIAVLEQMLYQFKESVVASTKLVDPITAIGYSNQFASGSGYCNVDQSGNGTVIILGHQPASFGGRITLYRIEDNDISLRTLELMREAYREEKDMRDLIQIKGMGCGGCCG